jgi:ribosome-binding protein aMBF1 (putative translation factor)
MKRVQAKLDAAQSERYRRLAAKVESEDRRQIADAARQVRAQSQRLRDVIVLLRAERERQGISLSELARRLDMDKGNLARLEGGSDANPTIATVQRIAEALGKDLWISLRDKPAA